MWPLCWNQYGFNLQFLKQFYQQNIQTQGQYQPIKKQEDLNEEENQNKWITLTRKDLEEEGYSKCKKLWTEEQDKLLKKLVKKYDMDWIQISKFLPQRNPKMCYSRFRRIQSSTKNTWKKEENQKILAMIDQIGFNWKEISLSLRQRTPKQIKQHYLNYLNPCINTGEWTIDDDLLLIKLLNKYGTNWKLIKENMTNRSQNKIKNHFFGKIKKMMEKKKREEETQAQVKIQQ